MFTLVIILMQSTETIYFWGCQLTLGDAERLRCYVRECIAAKQRTLILSANAHAYNLAAVNEVMCEALNRADWVRLDGVGPQIAARMLGYGAPSRIALADFIWDLAADAAADGHTLFLLGGRDGVAEKAAQKLRAAYPSLVVAGTQHGYFDKSAGAVENQAVLDRLNAASPDILVVGFGMPIQEKWILESYQQLPRSVIMTGGGVFNYVAEEVPRAHPVLCRFGFEWLGRLLIEPRRLWRRYVIGNPMFVGRVMVQLWRERFTGFDSRTRSGD